MQLDMREHRDQLESARRELEIRLWVQLHHLELMKSHGRSVARSTEIGSATLLDSLATRISFLDENVRSGEWPGASDSGEILTRSPV